MTAREVAYMGTNKVADKLVDVTARIVANMGTNSKTNIRANKSVNVTASEGASSWAYDERALADQQGKQQVDQRIFYRP